MRKNKKGFWEIKARKLDGGDPSGDVEKHQVEEVVSLPIGQLKFALSLFQIAVAPSRLCVYAGSILREEKKTLKTIPLEPYDFSSPALALYHQSLQIRPPGYPAADDMWCSV